VHRVLAAQHAGYRGEICVSLADNSIIKELNLLYLGRNTATDVITFDLTEKKGTAAAGQESRAAGIALVADIIISTDTAAANARIFKTSLLYELYLYAAHGTLHLAGYNDSNAKERKKMDLKARDTLAALGIT
jgi:probable rRNA maturation factor